MSGSPSGYQTPKLDWTPQDALDPTSYNRIEGNINAIETGGRTLDQALANPANTGTLRQIISWFAGRIRAITGKTNWWDAPDTTLAAAKGHMDATSVHSATSAATADRIILRDAAGRAQVVAPSVAADIARLDSITQAQVGLGSVENLTATQIRQATDRGLQVEVRSSYPAHAQGKVIFHTGEGKFKGSTGTEWL